MEAMVSVAGHGAASEGALLFASAASSGSSASEAPLSGYFVLAQQWPAGVCRGEDGCAAGRGAGGGWTLHGLWPTYAGGGWPSFCDASRPFDASAVSASTLADLAAHWPNLYAGASGDAAFWGHEWDKHGTCAAAAPFSAAALGDEEAYFGAALRLRSKMDLRAALDDAGIAPTSTATYPAADVRRALAKRAGGHAPVLHCGAEGVLHEAWLCLDASLAPTSCPPPPDDVLEATSLEASSSSSSSSSCGDVVVLPG